MTKKLYWEDSYLREFEATVISINEDLVDLDQTCFYPTGGTNFEISAKLTPIPFEVDIFFPSTKKNS